MKFLAVVGKSQEYWLNRLCLNTFIDIIYLSVAIIIQKQTNEIRISQNQDNN